MKKALLTGLITAMAIGTVLAQRPTNRNRDNHFFLPSRGLYFFYPGYYVSRDHHRGYYNRGFDRHPGTGYYDPGYVGDDRGIYRIYVQRPSGEVVRANTSDLIFKVEPPQALVYIDDKLIGSAGDFATERDRYMLIQGEHDLRIEHPDFKPFQTVMQIVPNKTLHLDIELEEKD